jgi:predicted MPP superfamily phosphohydrolase
MLFFLLTYFTVYGGMTVYALHRLGRGLGGSPRVWLPFWVLATGMMLLPMVLHRFEGGLGPLAARVLAGSGWTWLAVTFWVVCAFLAVDAWNLLVTGVSFLRPSPAGWQVPPRLAALGVSGLLPLLCLWGWVESGIVHLRTVEIESPRLPAGAPALRLVQIADMHLGRTSRPRVWKRVLEVVRAARPDVLVATGDLLDASDSFLDPWLARLRDIVPPFGKFAVLGNHEFYPGLARSQELLTAGGFTILRGDTVRLGPDILLAGVDDPEASRQEGGRARNEADVLPSPRADAFTILLKHRPEVSQALRERCDLQLSGHSHAGQIFPFGWVVRLVYPYPHARLVAFPEGLRLYVSRGAGTWGPPFRFLTPAEVTLFLLRGPRRRLPPRASEHPLPPPAPWHHPSEALVGPAFWPFPFIGHVAMEGAGVAIEDERQEQTVAFPHGQVRQARHLHPGQRALLAVLPRCAGEAVNEEDKTQPVLAGGPEAGPVDGAAELHADDLDAGLFADFTDHAGGHVLGGFHATAQSVVLAELLVAATADAVRQQHAGTVRRENIAEGTEDGAVVHGSQPLEGCFPESPGRN